MSTLIAYILIASFFILEGRLRQGSEQIREGASNPEKPPTDSVEQFESTY